MRDEKIIPLTPRCGCRVGDDGIGYLSAHPVSVSVKGPCYENECINGIAVPLGAPGECVGHRANVVGDKSSENCPPDMFDEVGNDRFIDEVDSESDASDEPEGLTDSSSEDDTVAPGGHVRRIVKGIEKLRRVRRVRGHRSFAPFR